MSEIVISDQFKVFFEKNKAFLKSLGHNFVEKHEEFTKFLNLHNSSSVFDIETERLMQSFCFMLSRLDLKIDYAESLEARTVYFGQFPELMRVAPSYAMTQFLIDPTLWEKASHREINKGDIFDVKNQFKDSFHFSNISTKKLLSHIIKSINYIDKSSPLCKEGFSHFEINLNLNLNDSKNILFYINSSLENSFNILDEIINKKNNCYIIFDNEKTKIPKSKINCSFNFEHYLNLEVTNNLYYLYDFFNYIKKHLFFCIDLTELNLKSSNIKILIEISNMDENFSSCLNEELFSLNVFPLVNVFYQNDSGYEIKEDNDKNKFTIENNPGEKKELICISSCFLQEKTIQNNLKMFSLDNYFIQENKPDTSSDFVWTELGWNFDKTKFNFQIIRINPDLDVEQDMFQVFPRFIYSESFTANALSKNSLIDKASLVEMSYIKQAKFLDFNPFYNSLFDTNYELKSMKKSSYLERLNKDVMDQNRDWVAFLNEMVDLLCLDSKNKLVFKKALQSLVWVKHDLYDTPITCPTTKINIIKVNNKYNGGIFLFEFLVKYLSLVNVKGLVTTAEVL